MPKPGVTVSMFFLPRGRRVRLAPGRRVHVVVVPGELGVGLGESFRDGLLAATLAVEILILT